MNNTIKTLLLAAPALLALAGCYEDSGNYDYISASEAMPVEIADIDSISITANGELQITPSITGQGSGEYEYLWYTLSSGSSTYYAERDTLSQERDLNTSVNLKVGKYTLYFRVKDLSTGVFTSTSTPLTVTGTDITSGWYVLKAIDGGVDFDYFSLSGRADRTDFITSDLGLSPLQGEPRGMMYQASGYGHETVNDDGSTTTEYDLSALHIITSNDYLALSGSNMSVYNDISGMFYEEPETADFQLLAQDDFSQMLINGGKIHTLGGIGKWGFQKAGDYNMLPTICNAYYYDMVYDTKSNQFYDCGPFVSEGIEPCTDMMTGMEFTELADSAFQVSDHLIHVGGGFQPDVFLIGYSPTSGIHYAMNVEFFTSEITGVTYYPIPSDSRLLVSDVKAMPSTATVIYYADGNSLYMYRIASGESRLMREFASGEQITFIQHVSGADGDGGSFNDIVVVTNTSSAYNVYRFPMVGSAGELEADGSAAMTGSGSASYVMFRQQ